MSKGPYEYLIENRAALYQNEARHIIYTAIIEAHDHLNKAETFERDKLEINPAFEIETSRKKWQPKLPVIDNEEIINELFKLIERLEK